MLDYKKDWWPPHSEWPSANDKEWKMVPEQAFALLLLEGEILLLNNDGEIVPEVNCSDVFAWGCADSESLPLIGFDDDTEAPFWELYELVRKNRKWGSTQWCILQRKQQPQPPVKRDMIKEGAWLPEFDSFAENKG